MARPERVELPTPRFVVWGRPLILEGISANPPQTGPRHINGLRAHLQTISIQSLVPFRVADVSPALVAPPPTRTGQCALPASQPPSEISHHRQAPENDRWRDQRFRASSLACRSRNSPRSHFCALAGRSHVTPRCAEQVCASDTILKRYWLAVSPPLG